ncbi:hypothetical protein RYX36_000794, partial [Vicia faba]
MLKQLDLLEKAVEELDNIVGKEKIVQESNIPKLKFLNACARKAFRIHPISTLNPPHLSIKYTIVGNFLIPKGSHVLLGRIGLGRNLKVWTEPYKFQPEHHLKNDRHDISLTK